MLGICRDMKNAHITNSNLVKNKVKINLDMLGAVMLHKIGQEIYRTHVVTIDKNRTYMVGGDPQENDEADKS